MKLRPHKSPDYNIPAVIVGMNLGGLGVARSLVSAGVPVIVVDDVVGKPELRTRRTTSVISANIRGPELIESLQSISKKFASKIVVIPTQRIPSLVISEHRKDLSDVAILNLPPHQQVVNLENKDLLRPSVAAAGLRLPETVVVSDEAELEKACKLTFPCILKPTDNDPRYMARFKKGYALDQHDSLRELGTQILAEYQPFVVQEWIPGPDSDLFFHLQYRDRQGQLASSFSGRKICIWPSGTGSSAACIAAPGDVDKQMRDLTNRFFEHLGTVGFCSMEFKRHSGTGELMVIEPTVARTDQLQEVTTLNGVNIPLAGYHDLVGIAPPPSGQPTAPKGWSISEYVKQSGCNLKQEIDGRKVQFCDAVWRWYDPGPYLASLMAKIHSRVKRITTAQSN